MKRSLIGLFLLSSVASYSQSNTETSRDLQNIDSIIYNDDGQASFENILEITGSTSDLFTKAVLWVNNSFGSSKAVTQTSDREAGILIIKGTTRYSYFRTVVAKKKLKTGELPNEDKASFTLKFFFKEGRAKVVITDITMINAFGFNFWDLPFSEKAIAYAKQQMNSSKIDDVAEAKTKMSQFYGFRKEADAILLAIEIHLRKKSEADF